MKTTTYFTVMILSLTLMNCSVKSSSKDLVKSILEEEEELPKAQLGIGSGFAVNPGMQHTTTAQGDRVTASVGAMVLQNENTTNDGYKVESSVISVTK